jgi:predicted metalloprotease with PDZ domain
MKYIVSYIQPHHHFVDIEFISTVSENETLIHLPAWRPGRYELGNFAKNIQKWAAFDENGNVLAFQKISKDCWKVQTKGVSELHILYNYYAVDLNAGSTFLDGSQLYMNPVNCCVYIPERINDACEMQLILPADYKIACGAVHEKNLIRCESFHELADSPFIASATLQHNMFSCGGVDFNLWFQGECKPDWGKLTTDFMKFCSHQMEMMKAAPFHSYHFLFQILPTKMYHGVEHTTSTVLALGPGYNLMKGDLYENLLGVCCHELFHAWNIKTIRPVEMMPYDYSKENYSKLGYVCEGVTTYYGDYLLFRSGVFNDQEYFKTLSERLQKHVDNFGRFNLSVADSSFDTWLDGYLPGIPNRKTNIYDEGNLLAFVTDMFIRKNSANRNSLDDVMRFLYDEFALKGKGYSDQDYKGLVEHFSDASFDNIFNNYINGTQNYEPLLKDALDLIGCDIVLKQTLKFNEHALGLKVADVGGVCKVVGVFPGAVADVAGIGINDEIVSVNNIQIKSDASGTNFTEWCSYFSSDEMQIDFAGNGILKTANLKAKVGAYYKIAVIEKKTTATDLQKKNFELWSKTKF